jgi:hypothetical protein
MGRVGAWVAVPRERAGIRLKNCPADVGGAAAHQARSSARYSRRFSALMSPGATESAGVACLDPYRGACGGFLSRYSAHPRRRPTSAET